MGVIFRKTGQLIRIDPISGSQKFWNAEVKGNSVTIHFGTVVHLEPKEVVSSQPTKPQRISWRNESARNSKRVTNLKFNLTIRL